MSNGDHGIVTPNGNVIIQNKPLPVKINIPSIIEYKILKNLFSK